MYCLSEFGLLFQSTLSLLQHSLKKRRRAVLRTISRSMLSGSSLAFLLRDFVTLGDAAGAKTRRLFMC